MGVGFTNSFDGLIVERHDERDNYDLTFRFSQSGLSSANVWSGVMTQDPRGRVLVSNTAPTFNNDFAVMRMLPNGEQDDSFFDFHHFGGSAFIDCGGVDLATALVALPDSRIAIAGMSRQDNVLRAVIARVQENGDLDRFFANDGVATFEFEHDAEFRGLAMRDDGLLIAGGAATTDAGDRELLFVAVRPDGRLRDGGVLRLDLRAGVDDVVHAMRFDAEGRLVVFAEAGADGGNDLAVLRFVRCPGEDDEPPVVDSGVETPDAGTLPTMPTGCGCSSAELGLISLALVLLGKRRRSAG